MRSTIVIFVSALLLVLPCWMSEGFAQQKTLVQFSGVIRNTNSDAVVPYVTIRNQSFQSQTFSANHQGYFSFVAHEGDTVLFTSMGYSPVELVIPHGIGESKYTADVRMTTDVIELEVVEPYPWASVDEFNTAFMSLEIADDNIMVAKRNLSPESLAAMSAVTPRNAQEMQTYNANQNHINLSNRAINQRMANPLLNPFAWGNFIRQITEGNKSRSKNNW